MTSHGVPNGDWVDELLLGGRENITRTICDRQVALFSKGLRAGGTVALWQTPSWDFVVNLLAVWRSGARAILFDHKLTAREVNRACDRLRPQLLVNPRGGVESRFGLPAMSEHVLVQLTSGSTGPAKVVARTLPSLLAELERYAGMAGMPAAGDRVVVLTSTAHTLGLIGGVLHALRVGAKIVLPVPVDALRAIAAGTEPTTVIGMPHHLERLASSTVPQLPRLQRTIVGGEVLRPQVVEAFMSRFTGCLGRLYGMTETGVLAEDLSGWYSPALVPAPGVALRAVDGELQVRLDHSPYLDTAASWDGEWLRTDDAASVENGLVVVHGRLDSRVTVGGRKVDLMDVERVVTEVPGVSEAVVVYDRGVVAYVVSSLTWGQLNNALATCLDPAMRPQRVRLVNALPRTATGKPLRDPSVLREVESSAA